MVGISNINFDWLSFVIVITGQNGYDEYKQQFRRYIIYKKREMIKFEQIKSLLPFRIIFPIFPKTVFHFILLKKTLVYSESGHAFYILLIFFFSSYQRYHLERSY